MADLILPGPTDRQPIEPQILVDIAEAARTKDYFLMHWSEKRGITTQIPASMDILDGIIEASRPLISRLIDATGADSLIVEANTRPVQPDCAQVVFTDAWHIDARKLDSDKMSLIASSVLPTLHAFGELPYDHPLAVSYLTPRMPKLDEEVRAALESNALTLLTPESNEAVIYSVNGLHVAQANETDQAIDRTLAKFTTFS